jgi:hypothetical protein
MLHFVLFTHLIQSGNFMTNLTNVLQTTAQVAGQASGGALVYLDKAMKRLRDFGVALRNDNDPAPVVALIQQISEVEPNKAIAIARVLQQASAFNEVVRNNIQAQNLSDRYEGITKAFNSIRDDAKTMVEQLSDGRITVGEKMANWMMRLQRGTISDRFEKIRDLYKDVSKDSLEQIQREAAILEAYMDFRVALKEGEILAHEIHKVAKEQWDATLAVHAQKTQAVQALGEGADPSVRARADLEVDQAMREVKAKEANYQVAKDIAENMKVSYSTGEVVMARLQQTSDVKKRVYQQSVAFFSTNETVLAAMNATFTGLHGLHESTQTLNAMKDGVNKSLEDLASIGNKVQMEGIKAGYGPTIAADSVKKLVDSVIAFQEESTRTIVDLRKQSTDNAAEIERAVREGQDRYGKLLQQSSQAVSESPSM